VAFRGWLYGVIRTLGENFDRFKGERAELIRGRIHKGAHIHFFLYQNGSGGGTPVTEGKESNKALGKKIGSVEHVTALPIYLPK